jgi:hypothetical protein
MNHRNAMSGRWRGPSTVKYRSSATAIGGMACWVYAWQSCSAASLVTPWSRTLGATGGSNGRAQARARCWPASGGAAGRRGSPPSGVGLVKCRFASAIAAVLDIPSPQTLQELVSSRQRPACSPRSAAPNVGSRLPVGTGVADAVPLCRTALPPKGPSTVTPVSSTNLTAGAHATPDDPPPRIPVQLLAAGR